MAGSVETRIVQGHARVALIGRIDHRSRPAFRQGADQVLRDRRLGSITVDLRGATALDGVTLGLILLMRDHARQCGVPFGLASPGGDLDEALVLAGLSSEAHARREVAWAA